MTDAARRRPAGSSSPTSAWRSSCVGHVWRYRYDKFGWTTRSSQLYESRLLRWGSPLFHFGILAVFVGHVMGLGIPKSVDRRPSGSPRSVYHVMAVSIGAVAGVLHASSAWPS